MVSTIIRRRRTTASTALVVPMTLAFGLSMFHLVQAKNNNSTFSGEESNPIFDFIDRFSSGKLTSMDTVLLVSLGVLSMESMNLAAVYSGAMVKSDTVPVRGKHLDEFSTKDKIFVAISKLQTGPFVYCLLQYGLSEPNLIWSLQEMSWKNTILPIPLLFVVFDLFYTTLHWALHIKAIYGFIHKHHHTQKAPSRANEDAINVHPIEYILGEYNHLFSLFICCRFLQIRVHMAAVLAFLSIGGVLAGWNHTRYDIVLSFFGYTLYDSKAHDVHHRIPQSNYGQYTMFWDHIFGTFREYDPSDRVNPKAQLDPKTGKSLEYMASRQVKND